MNRVDRIVLSRVAARVLLTIIVFFGLMALVESLDTWRFAALSRTGGPMLGILAIVAGAARAAVGTLPVTVLIGTIIGVLDLQARRELTVIKASGTSIWRAMRAPMVAALLLGLFAAFIADTLAIEVSRSLPISGARSSTAALWLEQDGSDGAYLIYARHPRATGTQLDDVDIFFTGATQRDRIEAQQAKLRAGKWTLSGAVRYRPDTKPEPLSHFSLATRTTEGDMQVRLTSARDLTFPELMSAVSQRVADPELRAAAVTSLLRLFVTPALLVGSVIMGFAFTAGYRRTNNYGGTVLYGIVLGFVVYVVTELANRSGFAGVLDPAFAAAGPAFVAIVIGVTVLLYKEDGRA
jgi:lipopolysaccharide export system permease protein